MGRHAKVIVLIWLSLGSAAAALDLPTTARQTAARDSALAQVALPTGPFDGRSLPTTSIEGPVTRRAYRLAAQDLTPLQIIAPLRAQLAQDGYSFLLDCDQDSCGGFDFRFAIEVLPAPNMYVNIRDYHFVAAQAGPDTAILLLASSANSAAYLQIITVGQAGPAVNTPAPSSQPDASDPQPRKITPASPQDLAERVLQSGAAILHDLEFALGTTTLAEGPSDELADLAALMRARPTLQIAVVGHTDTAGDLETNIAVSRARANAVRDRLIADYDVDPNRVEAAGMGYLAPVASNLDEDGRAANRRVEVIVLREPE